MACPPGNCAAWGAFRLCKPLPPIVIDGSYSPDELQLLWFCWRARSTGEYGGSTPVDLGFNSPGLIDISKTTNIAKIIAYCDSRGTLVRQFTNFSRFGVKFNLPNYKASGSFSTWSGGVFSGATSPGGGGGGDVVGSDPTGGGTSGGGGGGGATCPCTPDNDSDLTVVVCTELDCSAETPNIVITACGGTPPYQWSISGGGGGTPTITQSGTSNRNVSVVPPATVEVAGIAYYTGWLWTNDPGCILSNNAFSVPFGCQGESEGSCSNTARNPSTFPILCEDQGVVCGLPDCDPGDSCGQFSATASGSHDARTQQMKDDGCHPCVVEMDRSVITVTDDVGTEVATVIVL